MTTVSTDRIERHILLKAPRSRVWNALAEADEFGKWFGVALKGKTFVAGERMQGRILHPGYEHVLFEMQIVTIEPERAFSWRWHPYAVDAQIDYSKEDTTLVEFTLADAPGGTLLTLVESGFDNVPATRRLEAFRMNSGGWEAQMKNIEKHVTAP